IPPAPQIFHGRELELQEVVELLKQDSSRVAILGPGGIGKTSLARKVLHHPEVLTKYSNRHFIPCNSSLTCTDLISNIASHLGLKNEGATSRSILQHFKCTGPSLLILDNLETTWEPMLSRQGVENFLSILADIPQLALVITLRGAQRPEKIKWTRPFLQPLTPLSNSAALQMFMDIADADPDDSQVQSLLNFTGNLPLAVGLMANVAGYEGCDRALARWEQENIRLLSDGYDQRSSLEISIMLSYSSPRMTSGAQELLGILSMLPDGLSDADLIHSQLPIANILSCKATLLQVSLAYMGTTGNAPRLMSLVPIREYIRDIHPPTPMLKGRLRQYFHQILHIRNPGLAWIAPDNLVQVKNVFGNCHSLLSEALS
ncbi:P-loop containing nucleoside triphosphate hydrolase protein, partial [Mycena maculata]